MLRSVLMKRAPLKYWSAGGLALMPRAGENRLGVFHLRLVAVQVLEGVGLSPAVLDVQAFEIGRPTFVNPHVGAVGGADAVAEPFMAAFVNDDEIELAG